MVSCYAPGMYGGSFSASLIKGPGTSASATTAIEGFELTKKGKAIQAIRISTFASVLGGLISGLVLLLLTQNLQWQLQQKRMYQVLLLKLQKKIHHTFQQHNKIPLV